MEQLQFSQLMIRLTELSQQVGKGQFFKSGAAHAFAQEAEALGYTLQVTATNKSQLLLPVNPKRNFLFMLNDDPLGNARVAFGAAATMTVGFKLAAGGGGFLLDNHVPRAQINLIGDTASNSNITLIEA